jgi:hypothetical protein
MVNAHIQNAVDMVVVERIEYGFSASARLDELGAFQHAELMGNGGLRQSQQACDITNAKLGLAERVENTDPRRITEYLEKFGEIVKGFFFGHFLQNVMYDAFVYAEKIALFNGLFTIHIIILSL